MSENPEYDEFRRNRGLEQLGIPAVAIPRALQRADAEAAAVSPLEPPTAEGTVRYNKLVRFVREELIPLGWVPDNTRNYCRTISPDGRTALVVSSGDEFTGVRQSVASVRQSVASNRYPKGPTTEVAVKRNAEQLTLDLGPEYSDPDFSNATTWLLLHYVDDDGIHAELCRPVDIAAGKITDVLERILFPVIPRAGDAEIDDHGDDDGDSGYDVPVTRR